MYKNKNLLPEITADSTEHYNEGDDNDDEIDEDEESPFRDPPIGAVRLRPSQFTNIPATVFVEYPPELGIKRNDINTTEPLGNRKLEYKSYWERICIRNAHCRAGFIKSDKHWTSLWSKHQNVAQMKELNCLQKINHFPASWCIGRKDRLSRTLNTMKRTFGEVFNFHPETFILPQEKESLTRAIKADFISSSSGSSSKCSSSSSSPFGGSMWIVKPCASSCGQGIKVMTSQQALHLPRKKKAIVQRYLAKPYLINGNKFDLRIYVLVTGVDPLRVYIHDEGLTRISTSKYSLKNLDNRFAHLTNYSINKKADTFKAAEFVDNSNAEAENDAEMEGFKWSLAAFRRWLTKKEGKEVMEATFDRIFDLCLKTIIAAESEITPNLHNTAQYRTNCFELFGCDVILDTDLNAHLLEVNVSPSLMGSSPLDKKIKGIVVADLLHIVGLYPYDPTLLKKYNCNNGTSEVDTINPFTFSSLSKLMHDQEKYRRNPRSENVDMMALGDTDSSWLLLLMAEDELQRAKSSRFHLVHPTPANAVYYTDLYRNCRFSDHLLAHWVINGMSQGKFGALIPHRYIPRHSHSPLLTRPLSSSKYKSTAYDSSNRTTNTVIDNGNRRNSSSQRQRPVSSSRATRIFSVSNSNKIVSDDSNREHQAELGLSSLILSQHPPRNHHSSINNRGSSSRGKSEPRTLTSNTMSVRKEQSQEQSLTMKKSQLAEKLRTEVLNSNEKDKNNRIVFAIDSNIEHKQIFGSESIGKALTPNPTTTNNNNNNNTITTMKNSDSISTRRDRSTNQYIPSNLNRLIIESNSLSLSDKRTILSVEREILANNTNKLLYGGGGGDLSNNKRSLFYINKAAAIDITNQSKHVTDKINYSENMEKAKFKAFGNLENIRDYHTSSYTTTTTTSSSPVTLIHSPTTITTRLDYNHQYNTSPTTAIPISSKVKKQVGVNVIGSNDTSSNKDSVTTVNQPKINSKELYKVNKSNGMLEIFQTSQKHIRRNSNSKLEMIPPPPQSLDHYPNNNSLYYYSADDRTNNNNSNNNITNGLGQQIKSHEVIINGIKQKSGSLSARR